MLYSICKDEKPKRTVDRIRKILGDIGINLQEILHLEEIEFAPVSLRLTLKNSPLIGTNGKGTNKINALASGYAEFMERLQNSYLFPDLEREFDIVSDKKRIDCSINFKNKYLQNYFDDKLIIFDKLSKKGKNPDKCLFSFPFYSVRERNIYGLPYNIIDRVKGTNGMAAGNTYEEALVQGLSEVSERYVLKQVFINQIALPNIPRDEYLKYDNIRKIIEYFEINGYKVYVKDASLNAKVPVVCTIIEDTKNNVFTPSFGSHPIFPIAVERTLTEFAQGLTLSKIGNGSINYPCYTKEKLKYIDYSLLYRALSLHKVAFEKTEILEKIFWNNEVSYEFSPSAWISSFDSWDNKKNLEFLVHKILNFSNDIYVRDVSFLDFPSVDIFIPNVTDLFEYSENFIEENKFLDIYWSKYYFEVDRANYNLDNLLKLAEIYTFSDSIYSKNVFCVSFEYIAFLCSVVCKDLNKIIKYADILISENRFNQSYDETQIQIFKIIRDYCNIKKSKVYDDICIKGKLLKKYEISEIDYAISIINELNFDMVLEIVLENKKIPKTKYKTLLKRLKQKYKANQPKQMIFQNIFDFDIQESCLI